MKRLTEIGEKYGTDKATNHRFTDFYDDIFERYKAPKILEIGVARGASLRTYDDYYKGMCDITGFDNGEFIKNLPARKNIKIITGDQSIEADLEKCFGQYDIIIDDGGHQMQQQQISLNYLFEFVKSGGVYIIEDLHTSFDKNYNPEEIVSTFHIIAQLLINQYAVQSPYISRRDFDRIYRQVKSIQLIGNKPQKKGSISYTSIITKI